MLRVSRRTWLAIGALLVACGETLPMSEGPATTIDAGADTSTSETSTESDAGADGAFDASEGGSSDAVCTTDLPYGDPAPLANFDGLGAVSSVRPHRGGGPFAFVARDLGSGGFVDVVETEFPLPPSSNPVSLRSGPNDEDHPAPLAGNMKVYYDEPIDAGVLRIFSATRAQQGQKLENPQLEDVPLAAATSVMHPWSVAGQDILYVAARSGGTTVNIWRIVKGGATWTTDPQVVGPFEKTHPVVSDDELVMYFARNDTGKRKIFSATRSSTSSTWSSALEMQGMINLENFDDEPSWISPDQCTLIFTSNRAGAPRAYKIVREHR